MTQTPDRAQPRPFPDLRRKVTTDWAALHPARAAEERQLRRDQARAIDRFGHKRNGTVETHAKAAQTRQGSMARLFMRGSIDVHQLGAAAEIAAVGQAITRGLGIRTQSLETRVDSSPHAGRAGLEALGRVRAEWAYTRWRAALEHPGAVLALVIDDRGLSEVARQWRARNATVLDWLITALDAWPGWARLAREGINEGDLVRVEARLSA